jgi:hypothetical protein
LAKFGQGRVLDLANTFPGDAEFVADFLESAFDGVIQAEAKLKNLDFAGGESLERAGDSIAEVVALVLCGRVDGGSVGEEITEGTAVAIRSDGGV